MAGIYPHKTTTDTLPAEIDYIRRSRQSERLMAEMAASGEGGRTASWDFLVRSSREHVSDLQCTSTPKCYNNFIPFSPPYNQFMYSVKNMAGPRM